MKKLSNYLRAFRKRAGLSQEELSFLFGHETESLVWHHESGRVPVFETLVAYEYVFQTNCRELFTGIYEKVGQKVLARAQALHRSLSRKPYTPDRARKIEFLKKLIAHHEDAVRHL